MLRMSMRRYFATSVLAPRFDYKHLKLNVDAATDNIFRRKVDADASRTVELHQKYQQLLTRLETLNREKNANSDVATGKRLKQEIRDTSAQLTEAGAREKKRALGRCWKIFRF